MQVSAPPPAHARARAGQLSDADRQSVALLSDSIRYSSAQTTLTPFLDDLADWSARMRDVQARERARLDEIDRRIREAGDEAGSTVAADMAQSAAEAERAMKPGTRAERRDAQGRLQQRDQASAKLSGEREWESRASGEGDAGGGGGGEFGDSERSATTSTTRADERGLGGATETGPRRLGSAGGAGVEPPQEHFAGVAGPPAIAGAAAGADDAAGGRVPGSEAGVQTPTATSLSGTERRAMGGAAVDPAAMADARTMRSESVSDETAGSKAAHGTSAPGVPSRTGPSGLSGVGPGDGGRGDRGGLAEKAASRANRSGELLDAGGVEEGKNDANIERFMRVLRGRLGNDGGAMTVRLDPPSLGKIRVHMDLRGETMSLRIDAETHLAQRLLAEQSELLRAAVESAGLSLERLDIRPPEAERNLTNNADRESGTWSDAPGGDAGGDRGAGERDVRTPAASAMSESAAPGAEEAEPPAGAGVRDGRVPAAGVNVWA